MGAVSLDQAMARYRQAPRRRAFGAESLVGLELGLSAEDTGAPYYCSYPSFQDIYRIIVRMGERQGAKGLLLLCTLRGEPAGIGPCRGEGSGEGPAEGQPADQGERPSEAGAGGYREGPAESQPTACGEGMPEVRGAGRSTAEEVFCAAARRDLEREMARLRRTIKDGLRACDVYTRYSGNQYLAMLVGAGEKDGGRILARLEQGWQQAGGRKALLELTAEGIEDHSVEEAGDGARDICGTCHRPGGRHLAGTGHMAG